MQENRQASCFLRNYSPTMVDHFNLLNNNPKFGGFNENHYLCIKKQKSDEVSYRHTNI